MLNPHCHSTIPQIVTYLRQHAHPHVAMKVPIVPETVSDQIRLWVRGPPLATRRNDCSSVVAAVTVLCAMRAPLPDARLCAKSHPQCSHPLRAGTHGDTSEVDISNALRRLRVTRGVRGCDGVCRADRRKAHLERQRQEGVRRQVSCAIAGAAGESLLSLFLRPVTQSLSLCLLLNVSYGRSDAHARMRDYFKEQRAKQK